MVAGLRQAIDHFRSVEPREARAAWPAGNPIAEALADHDESHARGRREIERISRRLREESTLALDDSVDERFRRQTWLRRLLTADYHRQVQNVVRGAGWMRGELLDAIIEGYGLIQARLTRVMAAEQIERIDCEGHRVDPERMIVLQVVDVPDRPPGTVVKELRSGYTWKGRLLRYAEVEAASVLSGMQGPSAAGANGDPLEDSGTGEEDSDGDGDIDIDAYDVEPDRVDLEIEGGGPRSDRPRAH